MLRVLAVGRTAIAIVLSTSLGLGPSPAGAQGTLSGRVAIKEKPGETTTDFAGTVVYLMPKTGTPRFAETKEPHMDMNGRQFVPRVRVVTTGSTVEYPNRDPFSHNIFSVANGAAFDLGIYGNGTTKSAQFKKAGAFPVYCNIHAKMTGFVVVVASPWYTQAGEDGRWALDRVPVGKYVLHVWHERAPEFVKEVEVPVAGLANVDQRLDATGFKQLPHKNKFGQDYTAGGVRY